MTLNVGGFADRVCQLVRPKLFANGPTPVCPLMTFQNVGKSVQHRLISLMMLPSELVRLEYVQLDSSWT